MEKIGKNVWKVALVLAIAAAASPPAAFAADVIDSASFTMEAEVSEIPSSIAVLDSASFTMEAEVSEIPSSIAVLDSASFTMEATVSEASTNHAPTITLNSPGNGSTGVDINVSLNVTVSDPDGDNMTITFWNWTGSAWISWGQLSDKPNGTYSFNPSGDFAYNTTYTWRASVNDSTHLTNSETWTFTTAAEGETPNQPPTANFTWTANELTISFTDSSTDSDGNITSWNWSFGDNQFSTAQNPSHTYASSGSYTVTLTVKDNEGAEP